MSVFWFPNLHQVRINFLLFETTSQPDLEDNEQRWIRLYELVDKLRDVHRPTQNRLHLAQQGGHKETLKKSTYTQPMH
jgi:hypothetical protein